MSDRQDAVLASIDQTLTECICGQPIPENGPSLDYCSEDCQDEWQGRSRQGFHLVYDRSGQVALRQTHTSLAQGVTIPVVYDFIDQDALADLFARFDQDDPRVSIRDNLNRIQEEVWDNVLASIHGGTVTSANGSPGEGQEVFIGFDVTGDSITYALVTGDYVWRTGEFPIPEGADQEALAGMGQVVIKGTWTSQPATGPRSSQ